MEDLDGNPMSKSVVKFIQKYLPQGVPDLQSFLDDWDTKDHVSPTETELEQCLKDYADLLEYASGEHLLNAGDFEIMLASELVLAYLQGSTTDTFSGVSQAVKDRLFSITSRIVSGVETYMGGRFRDYDAFKRIASIKEIFHEGFQISSIAQPHGQSPTTLRGSLPEAEEKAEITDAEFALIPLEKIRETLYIARFEDDRLLREAQFYLAVRESVAQAKLIGIMTRVAQIACLEHIDKVISFGLPCVELTHLTPPAPIPFRAGFQYFSLNTQSPYWEACKRAKNIVVRIPVISDPQIELYAVSAHL
jgi:hypothetical protein